MFYKKINSVKMRFVRLIFNCIMIFTYLITYSSCATTEEIAYKSSDSFESGSLSNITKIELKNGIRIDCKDKLIKIEKESDSAVFIVIKSSDTIKAGSSGFNYKTKWNEQRIPESDVLKIHLEKTETANTVIFVSVIVVLFVGLLFLLTPPEFTMK